MFFCSFVFLCVTSSVSFTGFYTEDEPNFVLLLCSRGYEVRALTTKNQCRIEKDGGEARSRYCRQKNKLQSSICIYVKGSSRLT